MSLLDATILTAVATVVLAVGAAVTAVLAGLAFRKQSKEVSDQAEMLYLQRKQLAEQEKTSTRQAEVLELQGVELRASIEERKREVEEKRRAQAAQVTAWFAWAPLTGATEGSAETCAEEWGATVRNASELPVFDVRITFNWIYDQPGGRDWTGIPYGALPGPVTIVPPATTRHFRIPAEVRQQDPRCDDEVFAVSIWFTDAAGNRWERDARGVLKPLS